VPEETTAASRSFWTGAITFGLVSVPVALFPATRPRGVALRMVGEDGTPLRRRYVCSKDGKELDWGDIVRGYEVKKGKFVTVTDEELEAIEPRKSREIDLQLFVDAEEIDPKYFERAYYLVPAAGSTKGYRLLAEVMEDSGRAGIATFVMRDREYLVAIFSEKGLLRAETLRFEDEIRAPKDVGLPKIARPKAAAVTKFSSEIGRRSGRINFREFFDEYARRLEKMAEKKQRAGKDLVKAPAAAASAEDQGGEVIDLLQVLQKSLRAGGSKSARRRKAG
jgi:DNA end-binding protein Ku